MINRTGSPTPTRLAKGGALVFSAGFVGLAIGVSVVYWLWPLSVWGEPFAQATARSGRAGDVAVENLQLWIGLCVLGCGWALGRYYARGWSGAGALRATLLAFGLTVSHTWFVVLVVVTVMTEYDRPVHSGLLPWPLTVVEWLAVLVALIEMPTRRNQRQQKETVEVKPPKIHMPRSIMVTLTSMIACAALIMLVTVIELAQSPELDSPASGLIIVVGGLAFGGIPGIVAAAALVRGRPWAPVGVTIAAAWAAYLLDYWEPGIPLLVMVAATCAIVAVWTPTAKQYGHDVRARQNSGLR